MDKLHDWKSRLVQPPEVVKAGGTVLDAVTDDGMLTAVLTTQQGVEVLQLEYAADMNEDDALGAFGVLRFPTLEEIISAARELWGAGVTVQIVLQTWDVPPEMKQISAIIATRVPVAPPRPKLVS